MMLSVCVCIKMLPLLQPGSNLHVLSLFKPGILHRYTQSTGFPVSCRSLVIPHTTSQPTASSTLPWQMLWHPGRDATSLVMIWWPQVDTIAVFFFQCPMLQKESSRAITFKKRNWMRCVYTIYMCVRHKCCILRHTSWNTIHLNRITLNPYTETVLYASLEKQRKINSFTASPPTMLVSNKNLGQYNASEKEMAINSGSSYQSGSAHGCTCLTIHCQKW